MHKDGREEWRRRFKKRVERDRVREIPLGESPSNLGRFLPERQDSIKL
jgi:hypothetical protein